MKEKILNLEKDRKSAKSVTNKAKINSLLGFKPAVAGTELEYQQSIRELEKDVGGSSISREVSSTAVTVANH